MIKQLPNGAWRMSIYLGGRQLKRRYPTEGEAEQWFYRLKAAIRAGNVREVLQEMDGHQVKFSTIGEILDLYLDLYCRVNNRDVTSKESRIRLLKASPTHLARIPAEETILGDITRHVAARKKEGKSNATINREISILHHAFSWAVTDGFMKENPLRNWHKLSEQRMVHPYSDQLEEAITEVFKNLEEDVKPLFVFLYETGCRRDEALSLKHEQVDLSDRIVLLPKTKAGKPRYLGLTAQAVAAIQLMPAASEYVFYNPATLGRWYDCRTRWENAREAAKRKWLTMKDLRTAFAMRWADVPGIEKHVIQTLLGHADPSTTDRFYAFHDQRKAVKRALRLVEKAKEAICA